MNPVRINSGTISRRSPSGLLASVFGRGRFADRLFKLTTMVFALAIAGLVVLIIVQMARDSTLTFEKFGLSFIWRQVWDPVRDEFGALPVIYGTVVSSIIGLLIAVPVSIGVAIFLVEHAPRALST